MSDIKAVLDLCVDLFNTRLYFGSFSFTLMQSFLSLCVLGIIIYFILDVFGGD